MKAILMSGSYRKTEISQNIIDFILNNINGNLNICFIASNFKTFDKTDKYSGKILGAFKDKNIQFNNISIVDSRISKKDMINYIENSNIIFILGGDTLKQIKSIKHFGLKKYINQKNKIVIGISAGAINVESRVVLAKDIEDNIPDLSMYNGLGLTNINIEPHCDFKNKLHWEDLIEASCINKIVVMHDDCYIIINNDDIKYHGSYCVLDHGRLYYNNEIITLDEFLKIINYD